MLFNKYSKANIYQLSLMLEQLDPDFYTDNYERIDGFPLTAIEKQSLKNAPLLRDYFKRHEFLEGKDYDSKNVREWFGINIMETENSEGFVIFAEQTRFYLRGFGLYNVLSPSNKNTDSKNQDVTNNLKLDERVQIISEFINLVESAAKAKGVEFDRFDLPFTKDQLLKELKTRHKNNFRIGIEAFKPIWSRAVNAGVCEIKSARTEKGKDFLKSVLG